MSVRRNLLSELLPLLEGMGFRCEQKVSRNLIRVRLGRRRNTFYLFGGKDEGSAALIQGITLAGALLDEVALMPRSFVEQTAARCSVPGSRLWFSCNPESPGHWFYQEWILKAEEKKALRLQFTMADNPGLTREVLERYQAMFEGTFYRRFVLGEWVAAEGRVYDFFDESMVRQVPEGHMELLAHLLRLRHRPTPPPWGCGGGGGACGTGWRSTTTTPGPSARQRTDEEYADALAELAGGREHPRGGGWTPRRPASARCCAAGGGGCGGRTTRCCPASASPPGC